MIVMRNTKKKLTLEKAIEWYNYNNITIVKATRQSNRGANEQIYLIEAGTGCKEYVTGNILNYIQDNGNGHTGRGNLRITSVVEIKDETVTNILNQAELDKKQKLPVWVCV